MQTVVETPPYLADAEAAGVTEKERMQIVDLLASCPDSGDLMQRAGGARKLRFARRGGGKSGGYRIVTFFADETMPVFLLALFAKGDRANLSQAECNAIATLTKKLLAAYRKGALGKR